MTAKKEILKPGFISHKEFEYGRKIEGYNDNTFRPEKPVTRAEFVKMAITAFGLVDSDAVAEFNDVNVSEWSYPYIASAQKYGILQEKNITIRRFL